MQDRVHLFCDRHFDMASLGEPHGGGGGKYAFGDHAVHSLDDVRQLAAAAEFHADAAIPGEAARARKNQVAEPGKSGHSFGPASASDHKARHLGQPTGD